MPIEPTWNPLAGVALGGLLVGGFRLLPAVLLGFWGAGFAAGSDLFGLPPAAFSTLQAAVATALVRRVCSRPLALVHFRDIAAFLLIAGPVACVVAATLRTAWAASADPDPAAAWLRTWAGDALGGMIVTPIALALFAAPRDLWRPRLRTVAIPLVLIAAAVTAAHGLAAAGDRDRVRRQMTQTADAFALALQAESRRLGVLLAAYQHWTATAAAAPTPEQQAAVRGRVREFRALFPAADDLFTVPADRPPPAEYREAVRRANESQGLGAGPTSGRFPVVVRVALPNPAGGGYLGCWVDAKKLVAELCPTPNPLLRVELLTPTDAATVSDPDPAARVARRAAFANAPWDVVVSAGPGYLQSRPTTYSWVALVGSLAGTPLLVALLLGLTGQAAHVRAEVNRTATELAALHRERAAVEEALHEARREVALGRLAGGVAHEFNTLFTAVLGHVARARDLVADAHPSQAELRRAEQTITQAGELCQQILAFTGRGTVARQPVGLRDFLRGVAADVRPRLVPAPDVEIRAASGPITVLADPALLRRLVTNLLQNAAEAYPRPGGRVVIEYGLSADDVVWLTVTDFGLGMPADVADLAFEPFFSTKRPGRGLGLAAVRGVAQTHGGLATLTSRPGGGTTVLVRFAHVPAADAGHTPPPSGQSTATHLKPAALPPELTSGLTLVVDDDATVRELVAAALRGVGCEVLTAENGEEALDLYHRHADRVRLVVLDLLMPVLDGSSTLQRLRRQSPALPVVVVSAYSDFDLSGEFGAGSPTALLNKPFRPSELVARVIGLFAKQ